MPTPNAKPRPKVTVSEIAAHAGVSPATVSLVLNRRGKELRINPATQRRVLEAARKLRYVPNYLARGLTGASTRSIGLVWPLGGSTSNAAIAYEIIQRIAQRGYVCHMTDHLSDPLHTHRALVDQMQRRVDGLIIHVGGAILSDKHVVATLKELTCAVIITPREADLDVDLPHDVIYHDRKASMRQIADHLAACGRRRVGIYTAGRANAIKIGTLTDRLREHGVDDVALVLPDDDVRDRSYVQRTHDGLAERYRRADFPFDAVFCTNDELAVSMLAFLRDRALRVPDDVAVIGFDDAQTSMMQAPPLASVARYDADVAAAAETMLFDRMGDADRRPIRRTIAMDFIRRASAGAADPDHSSPSISTSETPS